MAKIDINSALTFILRYGALIQPAVALEAALMAKPRNQANVRKAGLQLIGAAVPNVNTSSPRLRAAIDELAAALTEASA